MTTRQQTEQGLHAVVTEITSASASIRDSRAASAEAIVRRLAECRTDSATELQYVSLVALAQQWVKAVGS